jgi:voltage-gated potassium channel
VLDRTTGLLRVGQDLLIDPPADKGRSEGMTAPRTRLPAPDAELAGDGVRGLARRPAEERERGVELLAARLDRPMSVLGLLFLLVVLGQNVAGSPSISRGFTVAGWVLWVVFVAEFLLRFWLAPSRVAFLKRNWWQVVFLLLPMLRFLRALALVRVVRAGRVLRFVRAGGVVSSAVRSSRSAGRILTSRIGWVAAVSAIVILASSQLLFTLGYYDGYDDALYAAAIATIAGQQLGLEQGLARVIDVALLSYSVAVFAALAGTLGAYFFDTQRAEQEGRPS